MKMNEEKVERVVITDKTHENEEGKVREKSCYCISKVDNFRKCPIHLIIL